MPSRLQTPMGYSQQPSLCQPYLQAPMGYSQQSSLCQPYLQAPMGHSHQPSLCQPYLPMHSGYTQPPSWRPPPPQTSIRHKDNRLQKMNKRHQYDTERLQQRQALEYHTFKIYLKMNLMKPTPTSSAISSYSTPSTIRSDEVSQSSKATGSTPSSFGISTMASSTPLTTSTDTRKRKGKHGPERTLSFPFTSGFCWEI